MAVAGQQLGWRILVAFSRPSDSKWSYCSITHPGLTGAGGPLASAHMVVMLHGVHTPTPNAQPLSASAYMGCMGKAHISVSTSSIKCSPFTCWSLFTLAIRSCSAAIFKQALPFPNPSKTPSEHVPVLLQLLVPPSPTHQDQMWMGVLHLAPDITFCPCSHVLLGKWEKRMSPLCLHSLEA